MSSVLVRCCVRFSFLSIYLAPQLTLPAAANPTSVFHRRHRRPTAAPLLHLPCCFPTAASPPSHHCPTAAPDAPLPSLPKLAHSCHRLQRYPCRIRCPAATTPSHSISVVHLSHNLPIRRHCQHHLHHLRRCQHRHHHLCRYHHRHRQLRPHFQITSSLARRYQLHPRFLPITMPLPGGLPSPTTANSIAAFLPCCVTSAASSPTYSAVLRRPPPEPPPPRFCPDLGLGFLGS